MALLLRDVQSADLKITAGGFFTIESQLLMAVSAHFI